MCNCYFFTIVNMNNMQLKVRKCNLRLYVSRRWHLFRQLWICTKHSSLYSHNSKRALGQGRPLPRWIQSRFGVHIRSLDDFQNLTDTFLFKDTCMIKLFMIIQSVFSERELKFMFAICHRRSVCLSSVCRLSVVCNVGAPYSGGWNFRQYFYAMWYLGHPWTLYKNFTEIVPGEPLRRGS